MLKRSFRPEFLNRLDEIVFFKPLTKKEVGKIVRLLAEDLTKRMAEKQLYITLEEEAVEFIVEKGYDPVYGARPLKRYMQHALETTLAKRILSGGFSAGDELSVGVEADQLTIQKK